VTYFCFIESRVLSTPHMEPLVSENADDALAEARDLLALHASGYAAHVFLGEDRVGTVTPGYPDAAASLKPSRKQPSDDTRCA
jgi:hypothetical protein